MQKEHYMHHDIEDLGVSPVTRPDDQSNHQRQHIIMQACLVKEGRMDG